MMADEMARRVPPESLRKSTDFFASSSATGQACPISGQRPGIKCPWLLRVSNECRERILVRRFAVEIRQPVALERVAQPLPPARVDAVAVRVRLVLGIARFAEFTLRELA